MANRYLIGAGGTWTDETSDIWAPGTGGAADAGGLGPADVAILDANSGNLSWGAGGTRECGGFDTTGYTGVATAAAGVAITVNGDLLIVDGTLLGVASWHLEASGDLANATAANAFFDLWLAWGAGLTTTLTDDVYANRTWMGVGDVAGAHTLYFVPTDHNYWRQPVAATGVLGVAAVHILMSSNYQIGRIDASATTNGIVMVSDTVNRTATAIGDWILGTKDLKMYNDTDTKYMRLSMGAHSLTGRDALLGSAGAGEGGGQLLLGSGAHSLRNINVQAVGDAAEDLLDFEACSLLLAGTVQGTGFNTFQNTTGVIVGGEVHNVNLGGQGELLHIYPAADSGNTNVLPIPSLNFGLGLGLDMAA